MVENPLTTVTPEKKIAVIDDVGVKPFEEFQKYIRIPQTCGVISKVVDVLNRLVSVSSLDIERIAKELNFSKRTLQRHLWKNGSSFIELRDKVRFKHAMICLLEKHMSIESTASYLKFSDRTSFTNSFKRWCGYSPSTFRKIYHGKI
jgi:AraC-like DNA-binding protein